MKSVAGLGHNTANKVFWRRLLSICPRCQIPVGHITGSKPEWLSLPTSIKDSMHTWRIAVTFWRAISFQGNVTEITLRIVKVYHTMHLKSVNFSTMGFVRRLIEALSVSDWVPLMLGRQILFHGCDWICVILWCLFCQFPTPEPGTYTPFFVRP